MSARNTSKMASVDVMFRSSVDCSLSKAEILRGVVSEKLTTVAREIYAVVERTVAGYEEEAAGLREQIVRQKKQLEALLQPRVSVFRIDVPVCEETFPRRAEAPVRDKRRAYEEDFRSWDELGPIEDEEVEDEWKQPAQSRPRKGEYVNLRVSQLKSSHAIKLSRCALKAPVQELRCRRDLSEGDFLDLLQSTFPDLTDEFDAFTADTSRLFSPLKLKTMTPEEISKALKSRGRGRSALYIRAKGKVDQPVIKRPFQAQLRKSEADRIRRRYRRRKQTVHMKKKRGRPRSTSLLNLRVCVLTDSEVNIVKNGVSKSRLKELKFPRGLQETDFLNLLRSSFPQLTDQFDAFTTDSSRRLKPLRLQTMTPEKINSVIKSRGKGRSALYIRVKAEEESLSRLEELAPLTLEDNEDDDMRDDGTETTVSSPDSRREVINKSDSSIDSLQRQQQEPEKDRDTQEISEDCHPLSPADSSPELDKEGLQDEMVEDEGDKEWKPGADNKPHPDSSQKKRRVKRTGVQKRRRKGVQSLSPVSCKVCQALSGSQNILIKHSWIHLDDPERLCGVCGERSESVEELRSHLESHQKIHSCKTCGKSFLHPLSLQRHESVHTGEKPYKCDICNKAYMCKNSLISHHWEHVEDKQHRCDVCGQAFAFKQQLKVHSRTHMSQRTYSCEVCGKTVSNLRSLSRHKLIHVGVKRYSCQVCGKQFLTPKNAKVHEKIHTDRDKSYLCDICCKQFHTPGQLKIHLRTHGKEKIACGQCGKGLSTPGSLKRHMVIHTGERAFKCSDCGRDFRSSASLRDHRKVHSGLRPFVCGVCGQRSYRKAHLIVHMRTHNGEKPYKCSLCSKAFTQSHCLKSHLKCHQKEDQTPAEEPKS